MSRTPSLTEALEARTMFAAHPVPVALSISTAAYDNGTELVITGTAKNDAITVQQAANGLVIGNTNGWTDTVTGNYTAIDIHGGAGNDTITVDASVTTNCIIYGDAGNDTIRSGSGNDSIYGGAGSNTMFAGSGNDTIVTVGGGSDRITAGAGDDSIWMDSKGDSVTGVHGSDDVHKINAFASITQTTTVGKKVKKTVTAVSKDLLGQKIADPTIPDAGVVYKNYAGDLLFSDSGPVAADVQQGYLGDCYFLATLASVAKTDPALIKSSIVSLGDGTFAVQFTQGNTQTYVRVDADLPTWAATGQLAYANTGTNNSLWVALMEKAYAQVRTAGTDNYANLNGGWMSEVYSALGKASVSTFAASSSTTLMAIITTALNAGASVTYGTVNTITQDASLIGDHAYSVDHVNYDTNGNAVSVTLRNPWGIDGAGNDGNDDGYVTVTASQLLANFLGLAVASV